MYSQRMIKALKASVALALSLTLALSALAAEGFGPVNVKAGTEYEAVLGGEPGGSETDGGLGAPGAETAPEPAADPAPADSPAQYEAPANAHAVRTDVLSPAYRSDITDSVIDVVFYSMNGAYANVYAQKQPNDPSDVNSLGTLELVAGRVPITGTFGEFSFPAADYPYGPLSLQIKVYNANDSLRDIAYLELFNKVGVQWKTGLANAPENPVTAGLSVVFADDFNAMPELSVKGRNMPDTGALAPGDAHAYGTRKPDKDCPVFIEPWNPREQQVGGMFGWSYFADNDGTQYDPFEIVDGEYMNLKTTYWPEGGVPGADTYWEQKVTTGFLSSAGFDGSGFVTTGGVEQYLECRMFTGPNPAMWPAFWTITGNGVVDDQFDVWEDMLASLDVDYYMQNGSWRTSQEQAIVTQLEDKYWGGGNPTDELDVVEAYLNSFGQRSDGNASNYTENTHNRCAPVGHQWGYTSGLNKNKYPTLSIGGQTWINFGTDSRFSNINLAMGFHTFAVHVAQDVTVYYYDNIEVKRHPTTPVAWEQGSYFMINGGVSDHYGIPYGSGDTFGAASQPLGFTRYGNQCYTYVDWVRVYEAAPEAAGRIGYTVTADGGAGGAGTTKLTLTFDQASRTYLVPANVHIYGGDTGAARAVGGKSLTRVSDTVYELELDGIVRVGDITVRINKSDIETETKTVPVFIGTSGPLTPPDIVSLLSPEYRAELNGLTTLEVSAPGGYVMAAATSVHAPDASHPDKIGYIYSVGPVILDSAGAGSITFDAGELPHGPVCVKVTATKADGKTTCDGYFQFYNLGGEKWDVNLENAQLPRFIQDGIASGAFKPLSSVFEDDFGPDFDVIENISRTGTSAVTGRQTRYTAHKPDYQDYGSAYNAGPDTTPQYNPFYQVEDYLKIVTKHYDDQLPSNVDNYRRNFTTGFLSTANDSAGGFWTDGFTEQYMEIRWFIGANPGTWPAFWSLSNLRQRAGHNATDEVDCNETWLPSTSFSIGQGQWSYTSYDPDTGQRYGGGYMPDTTGLFGGDLGNVMMGFHTYGYYITEEYTYYFFDNELVHTMKTMPLAWRDGNFIMFNGAIDSTKILGFPPGYGFERYGDQCDMYVDWFRVWEAPKPETPMFSLTVNSMQLQNVTANTNLTINIQRMNDAAKAMSGTFDAAMPAGWTVVSGDTFGPGAGNLQLVVRPPAGYLQYAANLVITPLENGGPVQSKPMTVMTRNTVSTFGAEIYPVYNKNGGWDLKIKLINTANVAAPDGAVSVAFPDGHTESLTFAGVPANGAETLTIENIPINIMSLSRFGFDITRSDGYSRHIDRALSGLTATKTDGIDISKPFDPADWEGAMYVHLGEAQYEDAGAPWGGEDNISVDQFVKWSDTSLYIAAIVKDDVHNPYAANNPNPSNTWANDGIQLSFDPNRAAGYASDSNHIRFTGGLMRNTGNNQITAGLFCETRGPITSAYLPNNGVVSAAQVPRNFYRDEENKLTYYLLEFPWNALLPEARKPVTPDLTDIGFTLLINDADTGGRAGWISYMYGIARGKDPSQFGDLILTADPSAEIFLEETGISVTNTKAVYDVTESFDASALQVRLNYSDGSFRVLGAAEYAVTGFTAGQVGTQTVTVVYNGNPAFTAGFAVTVVADTGMVPTGIVIARLPRNTGPYPRYGLIDPSGLEVKLVYSGGTMADIDGYTLEYDTSVAGSRQVRVIYGEFSASFVIYVDGGLPQPALVCPVKSMLAKVAKLQAIPYTWGGAGTVSFTSSNPAVCGVTADGLLVPMKAGIAVITLTSPNGEKVIFAVSVSV